MACLTLLFIVILATVSKVTLLHCSDQQLPASGDDDLQQVTTLQYCLVDDCTIMKIDTGEKLDIVYTTDSLIVTTPTDGHTSEVITRLKNELHCASLNAMPELQYTLLMVMYVLTFVVSSYILATHAIFKEFHNLFGKLLMLYNIFAVCICTAYIFTSNILPTSNRPTGLLLHRHTWLIGIDSQSLSARYMYSPSHCHHYAP